MSRPAANATTCARGVTTPVLPPVPPRTLLDKRYDELVRLLTVLYASHPDASAYTEDYRNTLAKCAASKVAYGTTYPPSIETIISHLNTMPTEASVE